MDNIEDTPVWEKQLLEKIVLQSLKEQRARRRWGVFFKLGFLVCIIAAFVIFGNFNRPEKTSSTKHTALVNLRGVIEAVGDNNAGKINEALQAAFEDQNTAGVILLINSPGGSPVQSGIVYDEIRRLREKYPTIPLYAVVEDICASGGYYIAAAADKIYVNKASIVGSIGVLMDGFGFTGTMDKVGVERRLLTAGENKGFLDPFSPQDEKQKGHARALLNEVHQQFINAVRTGRGNRLKETPDMFSGLMWTGSQSVQLGLSDDFGTVDSVARDVVQAETILDYSVKENIAERVAKKLGAEMGKNLSLRISGSEAGFGLR